MIIQEMNPSPPRSYLIAQMFVVVCGIYVVPTGWLIVETSTWIFTEIIPGIAILYYIIAGGVWLCLQYVRLSGWRLNLASISPETVWQLSTAYNAILAVLFGLFLYYKMEDFSIAYWVRVLMCTCMIWQALAVLLSLAGWTLEFLTPNLSSDDMSSDATFDTTVKEE